MVQLNEVWIVDYARTAFSRSRPGAPERDVFSDYRNETLLGTLLIKMFENNQYLGGKPVEKKDVQEFGIGTAMGVHTGWTYGGRYPIYFADFPVETSAFFIDKQCASAGAALGFVAMQIMTGQIDIGMATGVEHMTRIPMNNTWIAPCWYMTDPNDPAYKPHLDLRNAANMLQTAQRLYEEETPYFTKEILDAFGKRSHDLTVESHEKGWFKGEIIPLEGHADGNPEERMMIDRDMAARKSTMEQMAGLRRLSKAFYFEKNIRGEDIGGKEGYTKREGTEEGVITAGNSSPLNAGATACMLMNAEEAKKRGMEPLSRIVSMGWAGVDPRVMGRGPVPASKIALAKAGLTADDIDYWEINEAFCIVALNCMKALNIPEEKVNIHGGASAIGHPLGSTMVRLTGTVSRIIKEKGAKYGLANACIGGGQGLAVIVENLDA
ncbi:MAG: acetyl-CoA C-acyltransferase [Promethearchaeota archaeon]